MTTILITGGSGQVGTCLIETAPAGVNVESPASSQFDLAEPASLQKQLDVLQPDAIINCGSYTNVDKAESEPERAMRINGEAPGVLAQFAAARGIPLIHVSTDFVFDGAKTTPYTVDDATAPLSVYGTTKREGEKQVMAANPDAIVVRSSWIYSEYSNNFALKILELAQRHDSLAVVTDQTGSPCYARNLAVALWQTLAANPAGGIYHYTDLGEINRHRFAVTILKEAREAGILERENPVNEVTADHFPSPATRPEYSTLDVSRLIDAAKVSVMPWQQGLHDMMQNLKKLRASG